MKKEGFDYILTNPSFREDWGKIGKSSRPVDIRSKELDNTAVPLPFEIFATLKTVKYSEVEKVVHKMIDRLTDLRIRQNREFFYVDPQVALDILRDMAKMLDDGEITVYRNNKPLNEGGQTAPTKDKMTERRSRFKFSMIGVKPDDYVTFIPPGLKVRVASDDTVEYKGRLYKLSPYVGSFLPEDHRNDCGAYQGALYFS